MLTAQPHFYKSNKPSLLILFQIWVYNNLKAFADDLEASLVSAFNKDTIALEKFFSSLSEFTPSQALKEQKSFNRQVAFITRIDKSINENHGRKIKLAFDPLKKITYKIEARLNRIAFSDNAIIQTPDTLKKQLSDLSLESLSHLS